MTTPQLNERDHAWLNSLKPFIGRGDSKQPVPFWRNPDGTVDANTTMLRFMEMFDIKPKQQDENRLSGNGGQGQTSRYVWLGE